MPETESLTIERNMPHGQGHPLAQPEVLRDVAETMRPKQEVIRLVDYIRDVGGKPRGTEGGEKDLNSHFEEFIVKEEAGIRTASLAEVTTALSLFGVSFEILGVQSIGNKNQKIEAVVQGVNRDNPKSGFERPRVDEGPHMILAPFAFDRQGQLHLFRTIQYRTGEAEIDTPRGFADAKALESGQQMYDVEGAGEKVMANMKRIVGEESGDALQIKKVVFLGAPSVNRSFVTSKSAMFAVEVDYDAFITAQKVVSEAELQRRREQEEHEGLTGDILDITLPQYADYKRNSDLAKDMAADFGTDTVVIDFLERKLTDLAKKEASQRRHLSAVGEANRGFKEKDPRGYVEQSLRVSKAKHPERADQNQRRAEAYLSKLYRESLRKAS